MKNTIIYHCTGITEATDKSNIYYINSPRAWQIRKEKKQIEILDKRGAALAIFAY